MTMHNVRAPTAGAFIALTALWSSAAIAELPTHPTVAHLGPTQAEAPTGGEEFPFPLSDPHFGAAVAIRNGIAFVGIPAAFPTGHVAIYGQTATGWVRTATLSVSDPVIGVRTNGFGRALTFRDGLAVIASDSFVHVFRRGNGVWTDVQKLALPPSPGPTQFDLWQTVMHYENGVLAIGLTSFIGDSLVQVYELAPTGKFVKRATLRAPGGSPGFGAAVAIAGNTLVVGGADNAVYVFRRRSDGIWLRTQKLIGADSSPIDSFGAAVAIDQGMIIVGAPDHDCLDASGLHVCAPESPTSAGAGGAAYGFVPFNGQYVQVFKLRPGAQEHSAYFKFGHAIAMMGKYVVIDAAEQAFIGDPDTGGRVPGMAFTYERDGSTLTARGLARGYLVSDSIGLANNLLLVGAIHDPGPGCTTSVVSCFGEARIFDLSRFVH